MNDTDVSLHDRIRTFADAVRSHLDDLPVDEVDDIIDGLTADLTEQAADREGILHLDDPAAYAAELRSAAGLPARSGGVRLEPLAVRMRRGRREMADSLRQHPFGAWSLDLLAALRPVWWVLRGLAIYFLLHNVFGSAVGSRGPDTLVGWMLCLGLVLVSVQWGRGRWLPHDALHPVRVVLSVVAVLTLPFLLAAMVLPRVEYVYEEPAEQRGLLLDGKQVGNIFAYDEQGELLDGVQLYTDRGTQLNLYGRGRSIEMEGWWSLGWDGERPVRVPYQDARGDDVWNVYPLRIGEVDPATDSVRESTIDHEAAPFLRAPKRFDATQPSDPTPQPNTSPADPSATPGASAAPEDDSAATPEP
ncbi:hypothetical protein [Microbacterium sp. USHLN186]|uniref:hypothetical protein n=1 Tax=Microbacterium sp. USHLN186 TaxID=3081286 RepID=UPI00301594F6